MKRILAVLILALMIGTTQSCTRVPKSTWTPDNGNGTFTNPLFYDEFSDPDLIRVGEDYYLTGTTMHANPGLPVLHSKDLVNWRLLTYAWPRLDLGPRFRLENGESFYGQGVWAPSFRYHDGKFYIFTNVNREGTFVFTATDPAGPWDMHKMNETLHDLSVLFDDDGKIWVVWAYQNLQLAQLNEELTDIVPGTRRTILTAGSGIGEGSHLYKIDGMYYITSAWFAGRMRMPCARAANIEGPWEVNPEISADEEFGIPEGNRLGRGRTPTLAEPNPNAVGRMSLHQGGVVDTPSGEWWGFSMMDYNSVGRLTCLSPVTWKDGWPYFGLPGNLIRTPRTWVKPDTGHVVDKPYVPYQRDDEFDGPELANVWQWNHVPDDSKWSLTARRGYLRLNSLPAPDFWMARNSLTQRGMGPESAGVTEIDLSGLEPGDVAGLALLNYPYSWIGVRQTEAGRELVWYDQHVDKITAESFEGDWIWLRAHCDFLTEKGNFSVSTDGETWKPFGEEVTLIFQLTTFQGVRYALFNYNTGGGAGGYADFERFELEEPHPSGFTRPIPFGQTIVLENMHDGSVLVARAGGLAAVAADDPAAKSVAARFAVRDRGLGRVALRSEATGDFVAVRGLGEAGEVYLRKGRADDPSQDFQWTEMPYGDLILLSLESHRHLRIAPDGNGTVTADAEGAIWHRRNGASFRWRVVE